MTSGGLRLHRWRLWIPLAVVSLVCFGTGQLYAQDVTPRATFLSSLPGWLSITGSIRVRPEERWTREFTAQNDEAYTLTRLRLGVGIRAGQWARFFVEGQDSRAIGLPRQMKP